MPTNAEAPLSPTTGGVASDPFTEAESRYWELIETARQERLSSRALRASVRALMIQDGDANDWVLGPRDGLWYRRDHDRWVQSEPPRRLVCTSCGHRNLPRHTFCVQCSTALK